VICPITDAFVAHHGALGGFVRVWCTGKATPQQVIEAIRGIPGLESVLDKETACRTLDLPFDREGDVVVISTASVCVGASEKDHDLSGLAGHRLRTHGGVSEARVPFIINTPMNDEYRLKGGAAVLRSYQLFDFAINGTAR
jgi:phosphonoacetate hydrolase